MGIFTSTLEICDKCGKLTVFDGPYSNCGCYRPPDPTPEEAKNYISDKELLINSEGSRRIVNLIREELRKKSV